MLVTRIKAKNNPIYTCFEEVNAALEIKYATRAINVVIGNDTILSFL